MEDPVNHVTTPGGRIGDRIARLVADSVVHTRQRMQKTQSDVAKEVFTDVTNHVSDEVRGAMGHLFRTMASDPNAPDEIRPLLHHLGNSRGQAWAWIGGLSASAALGGGLMDLITNYLNPVIKPMIALAPAGNLSADTAARMAAHNIGQGADDPVLIREAAYNGIDEDRFNQLVELAKTFPAASEILDMINRGIIDRQVGIQALKRQGLEHGWADALTQLADAETTLPEISALWNRSVIDSAEATRLGKRVGYNATQIQRALELGGDPLPPQDLGEAYRRGFIDRDRFNRGIVQGPLRNEWFDVLERLQFRRMSPQEAAEAVNQGHLAEGEGRRIAHEHGLDPEDFSTIIATAGTPPGLEFATEAYNRGLLSDADWEVMFKESRIKNRYIPLMRAMRTRLVPTETIRLMYREGVVNRGEALESLKGHGFTPAWANAQLDLEDARKTEGTKELSRAQVIDLYDEDLIDKTQAATMLQSLGYDQAETNWQLELAEVNKMRRFINLAIGRIRTAYISNRIDAAEAAGFLDQIGISPVKRENLFAVWDVERETIETPLTTAQIHWAMKNGHLSAQQAYDRFLGRGYAPEDAAILVRQGGKVPPQG